MRIFTPLTKEGAMVISIDEPPKVYCIECKYSKIRGMYDGAGAGAEYKVFPVCEAPAAQGYKEMKGNFWHRPYKLIVTTIKCEEQNKNNDCPFFEEKPK